LQIRIWSESLTLYVLVFSWRSLRIGSLSLCFFFKHLMYKTEWLHINYTLPHPRSISLSVLMMCVHARMCTYARKEGYVLRKLQCGLTSLESWCEYWNTKINEERTQVIYLSHWYRPIEAHLTLKGWNMPFISHI